VAVPDPSLQKKCKFASPGSMPTPTMFVIEVGAMDIAELVTQTPANAIVPEVSAEIPKRIETRNPPPDVLPVPFTARFETVVRKPAAELAAADDVYSMRLKPDTGIALKSMLGDDTIPDVTSVFPVVETFEVPLPKTKISVIFTEPLSNAMGLVTGFKPSTMAGNASVPMDSATNTGVFSVPVGIVVTPFRTRFVPLDDTFVVVAKAPELL